MKRKDNWDSMLFRKIRATYGMQFEWGTTDCVKWTMDIVNSLVEEEVTIPVEWTNKAEALTLLKQKSLKARIIEEFGKPQSLIKTSRGDIVYIDDLDGGPTMGISAGDKAVFISRDGGIITRNILDCDNSWSIDG